ncbi:type II toxin-antitoxin system VapC family toxin [Vreelandella gomseomensis]|uniref:Type II toxin-antitoxin system VapC family toxin n=1 Tax=Vreelandella gomseomensis TaxID=370766 RepID=A0ABU1GFU5_9GAMM|nr:type II toxin-antitoxin system VapC family toxin [Halomonas gomseomensis]MDR5875993.1 type II toxin-antitoxin system VapC family toxin [Halomonas gomseomensis]
MNGRYLLDTNAIIYALNRKLKLPANRYAVSVVTEMELLSWPSLTGKEEAKLKALLQNLGVIQLEKPIQDAAIKIRRTSSLKLPDSIISATALIGGFVLVTDDQKLSDRHIGNSVTLDDLISK